MKQPKKLKNLDLVEELLRLVFEYQNKGGGDAFLNISGHVQRYDLTLYNGQWGEYGEKIVEKISAKLSYRDLAGSIVETKKAIINIKPIHVREKEAKEKELTDKKEQLAKLAQELNVKIV